MLASVYRSNKKDEMYLYVSIKDDFSKVPEALMKVFGKPEFAMQLNLTNRKSLARADIEEVKNKYGITLIDNPQKKYDVIVSAIVTLIAGINSVW